MREMEKGMNGKTMDQNSVLEERKIRKEKITVSCFLILTITF